MATPTTESPRRGRAGKRDAITRAARRVFGRDGYTRSSIDAIAAEADVSTRTIYNHFDGKEQLFTSVLLESATRVADTFVAMVERLDADADVADYLTALAGVLAAQSTEHPEHFTMVRQISAEADHFPPETLDGWRRAGPLRVEGEVARRLGDLADQSRLAVRDPQQAARHLIALTASQLAAEARSQGTSVKGEQADAILAAGVDAFLHGYAAHK